MSVRRRGKKGTYQFDFQHRGLRLRGSTGTTERAAALRIEGRRRIEVAEGRHRRPEMSLNEAAERYFQEIARHQPSAATTDYQLENLVKDLGPGTRLSEIDDAGALATYIARRRARVSDSSVNREIQLLRRVMRRAERVWKVAVDMPVWTDHMLVEPAGRIRELTADEEAALFQSLRPDFHPLVMFCLITGARRSEALTLTWRQVDMGAGVIVLRAKSRRPGGEPHVIPMTGELRALLQGETGHNPVRVFTYVCKRSRGKRRTGAIRSAPRAGLRPGGRRRPPPASRISASTTCATRRRLGCCVRRATSRSCSACSATPRSRPRRVMPTPSWTICAKRWKKASQKSPHPSPRIRKKPDLSRCY